MKTEDILSRLRTVAGRVTFEAGSLLRMYPRLYVPIARKRAKAAPISADTDIVIEGYPRSGNTFAITAFGSAQTREVRVAHHEHAAAQVIAAARARVPAIVLIREPEDAVLSFAVQQPDITLGQALRTYDRFYRPLLPYRDRFVLARFEEVTSDFGAVIRRVNQRFGTDFGVFDHTEENASRCIEAIEAHGTQRRGKGELLHRKGSFPSDVRTGMKAELREEYRSGRLKRLRERAERTYRDLVS